MVAQTAGVLPVETFRKTGLDTAKSAVLTPWRKARAVHDPGKILLDEAAAHPAPARLPKKPRRGRRTLIRAGSANGTHDVVAWLVREGGGRPARSTWRAPSRAADMC